MHPQMKRLREAVAAMHRISGASDLARALNCSPQTIHNWSKRGISKEGMLDAQRLFGVSASWIETGEGAKEVFDIGASIDATSLSRATPKGRIPLISWVKAGHWAEIQLSEGGAEQENDCVYADESKPSHLAFALRVEGDSMTSTTPPSFPEGCVIIVDPNRAPKAGDYVIAKDVQTQRATFKRLMTDGSRWYLKPLNPSYQAIEIDDPAMRVIGVVIEWKISGRL